MTSATAKKPASETEAKKEPSPAKTTKKPAGKTGPAKPSNAADKDTNPTESIAKIGHNSEPLKNVKLKNFFAEITRLEALKKDISEDISQVWKSAEGEGFDKAAMKAVLKRQNMSEEEREKLEAQIDLYEGLLGTDGESREPEDKGVKAAAEGQPVTANPYTKKSPNHARWQRAWTMQAGNMATETTDTSPTDQKDKTTGTAPQPDKETDKAA